MSRRKHTGIYRIVNTITGDQYIGSAKSISDRWYRHLRDLDKGRHHSLYLQRAWCKYGQSSFVFETVEICLVSELCDRENFYLHRDRPVYNICPDAYSQTGRKLSAEHIAKITKYVQQNNVRPPACTWEQKRKKVVMLDKDTGDFLAEFESLSDACRFVGRDHTFVSTISGCCNGTRPSAYGYRWKWAEKGVSQ